MHIIITPFSFLNACHFSKYNNVHTYFKNLNSGASCLLLGPPRFNWCFSFAPGFQYVIRRPGISIVGQLTESVSPRFLFIVVVIMIYLKFVHDDSLTS